MFYEVGIWFDPVSGNNWAFTDNIFDYIWGFQFANIANHHNAYVRMNGSRLLPHAPTNTDPDLATLSYESGPLGQFYLPTSATALFDKGSRTAAAAGLYHFTSITLNVKEGNEPPNPKQVNIGPHYLALVNGSPADSDSDGIADFIEDRNGNGMAETTESSWTTANTGSLAIVFPTSGSTVCGVTQLRVSLDSNASAVATLTPLVDGQTPPESSRMNTPARSLSDIEVDTRRLPNGTATFQVQAILPPTLGNPSPDSGFAPVWSVPISLNVNNDVSFAGWKELAGADGYMFHVAALDTSMQSWAVDIFDSSAALASNPQPVKSLAGVSLSDLNNTIWNLQDEWGQPRNDASIDPFFIAAILVVPMPGPSVSFSLPRFRPLWPWPFEGRWVVAQNDLRQQNYDKDQVWENTMNSVLDAVNPVGGGAYYCTSSGAGKYPHGPGIEKGQTWPLRYDVPGHEPTSKYDEKFRDAMLLYYMLEDPFSRNLFFCGHGNYHAFNVYGSQIVADALKLRVKHRYRFAFLFACRTLPSQLPSAFGIDEKGPLPILAYAAPPRNRPAAYVGYTQKIPYGKPERNPVPWADFEMSKEQAYFLSNFMLYWVYWGWLTHTGDWTLEDALYQAKQGLPNDGLTTEKWSATGTYEGWVGYHAGEYLEIWGCTDLTWNGYNQAP